MEQLVLSGKRYSLYNILTYSLITLMLTCDALAFESVKFWGIMMSASGILFPISYTISSVITYTYGFEKCKRSIFYMMISQMFFCLSVCLFSRLGSNQDYLNLYSNLWKVVFSSTIAVYTSMYVNSTILSFLKIRIDDTKNFFNIKYLITIISANLVSQFILVIISYSVNFNHILSINEIEKIIIDTYLYKIIISSLIIIFFSKILYKTCVLVDRIDTLDINVKYSPVPFKKNNYGFNKIENKGSKIKKIISYILEKNQEIKEITITDVLESKNKLIVHFKSIESLHESKLEYKYFFDKFKYKTKLDEIIKLNNFYEKFRKETEKLNIYQIDSFKKSITLKRIYDNKTFFIKFEEINQNLDTILKLPQEQIEWLLRIDYNFKNIEHTVINKEKDAKTKLMLLKSDEINE